MKHYRILYELRPFTMCLEVDAPGLAEAEKLAPLGYDAIRNAPFEKYVTHRIEEALPARDAAKKPAKRR